MFVTTGQPFEPVRPVPRKSNTTKIVLLIVAAVLAVCCVIGSIVGLVIYKGAKSADPARAATRGFIDDLRTERLAEAYNQLCASTRASFTEPAFEAYVARQPEIASYSFSGFSISTVNGHQTATIDADLTATSAAVDHHSFLLTKENGQWLICGQPY